jgi:hypothetical protein
LSLSLNNRVDKVLLLEDGDVVYYIYEADSDESIRRRMIFLLVGLLEENVPHFD